VTLLTSDVTVCSAEKTPPPFFYRIGRLGGSEINFAVVLTVS